MPGNLLDHFPGFQGFPGCVGTLGERSLQCQESIESLCFHGLLFSSVYLKAENQSEKVTKPGEVFQSDVGPDSI